MNLTLKRFSGGEDSTLGLFFIDYKFRCFTCEDQAQVTKVPGETRIPAGRYQIKFRTAGAMHEKAKVSGWHKGMLWLQDVPDFEWIYIHIGNNHLNTLGCILVGLRPVPIASGGGWVERSGQAYFDIYQDIAAALESGEEVWINVEDETCLFPAVM